MIQITATTGIKSHLAAIFNFLSLLAQVEAPFVLALTHQPTDSAASEGIMGGILGLQIATLELGSPVQTVATPPVVTAPSTAPAPDPAPVASTS